MKVVVNRQRFVEIVGALLERKRADLFPYNLKGTYAPQLLIPEEIKKDKKVLALFYFYICTYMRGGIESHTVFKQFIQIWHVYPEYFDPEKAKDIPVEEIQNTLRKRLGWYWESAGRFWSINSERLIRNWSANPLELIRDLNSYDEAIARIANKEKMRKAEREKYLGPNNEGFIGFQHKMVSLLLYFYDWEGWLPSFLYPSPVDIHMYRIMLANEAIIIEDLDKDGTKNRSEISKVLREELMHYMITHNVDPVELGDAVWQFSLSMCGESPATATSEEKDLKMPLFIKNDVPLEEYVPVWTPRKKKKLLRTCGICILRETCKHAIPSKAYSKGVLMLRKRDPLPYLPIPDELPTPDE